MLNVTLSVKFRFLGMDLYKYSGQWLVPVPVQGAELLRPGELLNIDERGVKLKIESLRASGMGGA